MSGRSDVRDQQRVMKELFEMLKAELDESSTDSERSLEKPTRTQKRRERKRRITERIKWRLEQEEPNKKYEPNHDRSSRLYEDDGRPRSRHGQSMKVLTYLLRGNKCRVCKSQLQASWASRTSSRALAPRGPPTACR